MPCVYWLELVSCNWFLIWSDWKLKSLSIKMLYYCVKQFRSLYGQDQSQDLTIPWAKGFLTCWLASDSDLCFQFKYVRDFQDLTLLLMCRTMETAQLQPAQLASITMDAALTQLLWALVLSFPVNFARFAILPSSPQIQQNTSFVCSVCCTRFLLSKTYLDYATDFVGMMRLVKAFTKDYSAMCAKDEDNFILSFWWWS